MAQDARYLPILTTPGVIGFVCVGPTRATVEDGEIEAIREVASSGLPVEPHEFLEVGQEVVIESGPLAGLSGVLVSAAESDRLVVSVRMLRRAVAVEIDRRWVTPRGGADEWNRRIGERIHERRARRTAAGVS